MPVKEVKFQGRNQEAARECLDEACAHGLQDCLVLGYSHEKEFVYFLSKQLQVRDVVTLHRMLGIAIDRMLCQPAPQ